MLTRCMRSRAPALPLPDLPIPVPRPVCQRHVVLVVCGRAVWHHSHAAGHLRLGLRDRAPDRAGARGRQGRPGALAVRDLLDRGAAARHDRAAHDGRGRGRGVERQRGRGTRPGRHQRGAAAPERGRARCARRRARRAAGGAAHRQGAGDGGRQPRARPLLRGDPDQDDLLCQAGLPNRCAWHRRGVEVGCNMGRNGSCFCRQRTVGLLSLQPLLPLPLSQPLDSAQSR